MENETEREGGRTHWVQSAVSWGELLISLLAVIVTVASIIVLTERRITQIEERQQFVLRYIADDTANQVTYQREVRASLDEIKRQLSMLTIELTRHQAVEERYEKQSGIRIPKAR